MSPKGHNAGPELELLVRRTARALWPGGVGSGSAQYFEGRERDCIFVEEHVTHYVECTISKKIDKLKSDSKKMTAYRDSKLRTGQTVKLWFVTLEEPTADQRKYGLSKGITVVSAEEFRRQIIDAPQYLEVRSNHPFGSATDPERNESSDLSGLQYQQVGIRHECTGALCGVPEIVQELVDGRHAALLGDYGVGKSVTIKQIFDVLRKKYFRGEDDATVPIVLNLREHWGQSDPAEALSRHASQVGFTRPYQLIRALNAGRVTIVLDGFDEVGAAPWSLSSNVRLRQLRRQAVRLVANFIERCRGRCGLLVAGRPHFFDNREELVNALGLGDDTVFFSLGEFTEVEVKAFLASRGVTRALPAWLPRRPLLLASLLGKGLLAAALDVANFVDPARGWDALVSLVCRREASIHSILDEHGVRRLLEYLASVARSTGSGLGPITEDDLAEAFRWHVGAYPDETARPLLQRLPGLSHRHKQDGSRMFLDDHLLDALRAGQVVDFLRNPWAEPAAASKSWQHGLGDVGSGVAALQLAAEDAVASRAVVGAREAAMRWESPTLAMDCVQIARCVDSRGDILDFNQLAIAGADCTTFALDSGPAVTRLRILDSAFQELTLPEKAPDGLVLEACIIGSLFGCPDSDSIPGWMRDCDVLEFEDPETNSDIMHDTSLELGVRVMLTILRKLYQQRGSARKDNALRRGMRQDAQRLVKPVLGILASEGVTFAITRRGDTLWQPVVGQRQRVGTILETPRSSSDSIVKRVRQLT